MKILVINPGTTTTKIAVFCDEEEEFRTTLVHDEGKIHSCSKIQDQKDFRKEEILNCLQESGYSVKSFDAIASRGGLVRHIPSGTYRINEQVVQDLVNCVNGEHASNLGPVISKELGEEADIPSFFTDPIVVDEMQETARYSGFAGMQRESIFHALNHKSVARKAAAEMGRKYEDVSFIVAHLGGGVSVCAHEKGRVIDVFNTREEGAMCMDRGGSVPTSQIVRYCFSGIDFKEAYQTLCRESGIYSYLGTREFRDVENRAFSGDEKALGVFRAFAYQVAKDIGAMGAVLKFNVDAIILTGGIVYSERFCDELEKYIKNMASVIRMPGEEEMRALAEGTLRVLRGEPAGIYSGEEGILC